MKGRKRITFGVVIFPGTNCDRDTYHAVEALGYRARYLWHVARGIPQDVQCVILPGGFSYGDYLRAGAIAKFARIMDAVTEFADRGGLVLGICNGFQILVESGLLPGALLQNVNLRFICEHVYILPQRFDTPFTCAIPEGRPLRIPIAHIQGRYTYGSQKEKTCALFCYCDRNGNITGDANPNGSEDNIAGIVAPGRLNVAGMMPHPERAAEIVLGSNDGAWIFRSVERWLS